MEGEPPAKVTWWFKGKDQSTLEDVVVENPPYETSITINKAARNQSGMYLIRAVNEHGKDECEVEFTVLSPPSKPEGPLEVFDVHKEGCKVRWKPPLDDGGSPITAYILEKMDTETGNWIPCGQTEGETEISVERLETGKRMKFRVRAKNAQGESEHLEGPRDAVLIKDPFDPPGPPGLPEVIDWTESTVKLKWEKPLRENGAPVTHYTIEFREHGKEEWRVGPRVKAKKFPDGDVTSGLIPGKKYEFRVKAENKAGLGDPSEHTNPHFMKARFAPPKIDRSNLDTKTVKVNQQVVIDVDVTGEPAPETKWFYKGEEIVNSEAIKTAHSQYHTKLMLVPAKRTMIGKYTIKAKNSSGEDEAEVEIVIKGKPGPPKGPLEVFDITKKSCKLKWKPPLDDGGSPIEYYEIEKLDPNTGEWIPAGTSPTCEGEVKGLNEGKEYKFRVRAVNAYGESLPLDTDESIIAKNPFDPPAKPDPPVPLDWGPDFCDLKWKPPKDDGGSPITGYIIEVRDKDRRKWKEAFKVNERNLQGKVESPFIVEDHEYEFRVIAVNKAGPSEPSNPSDTIKAKIRFLKPRIDRSSLQKKVLRVNQLMRIDADYVGAPDPKITWFKPNGDVLEADDYYHLESRDNRTLLVVRRVQRKDSGIYKIVAKNELGSDTAEVEVTVISVPGKPMGPIEVSNVTAHTCHLDWKPPKDDGGDPIKFYTVEKMDTEKGIWVPCGETIGRTPEFDVEGLNEGSTYMFRVKAVNNEGESEPLETDTMTLAKNPFDPPGPPKDVKIEDYDRKWVKLSWTKPSYDGGARITHYVIEKKEDISTRFVKAVDTDTDECFFKVTDLTENSKYKFRVRASNKAGVGPPSEPSEEVICRLRNAPPIIDRSNLDGIRVKVGEQIKLDVKVTGAPVPEKTWRYKNTEVRNTSQLTITNEDYKTKFLVISAKREDSGTYTIKAKNRNGTDEADVDILVVGPPSPPTGPLKVEDIFADRCKAFWKLPRDDGGSPITHYIIEKMDVAIGSWVACGKSSGLSGEVFGLEEMHEYQFRVKAVNSEGESEPLEGLDSIIAKNPFDTPGPPGKPVCTDYDFDHFDLKWEEPRRDGGSRITGYIIEKRLHNDDLWTKTGEVRSKLEFGTATDVVLHETYVFRVRAVNAAGQGPPGPESDNLTCRYKKLKPKINRKVLREITVRVGETIEFDVDIQGEPPPDVTWSKDGKSLSDSDSRRITNKPYRTIFYVDEATRKDEGVYLVSAVNINGKDAAEVRVNVVSRPGPPEGPLEISGVHKNGCKIAWKPPKDDGGLPIAGYMVEKLDVGTGIWSPVGMSEGLTMSISGLEHGKEYEFRVRAVNEEGESDNLQTLKPITAKDPFTVPLPPSAPEVVDWSEDHMALEWKEPIDDGGSPVTGYIVEKKAKHDLEWSQTFKVDGNRLKGTAQNLTEGVEYQFRVIALNKAGPSEPGQPSRLKEARARFMPPKIERKQLSDITISAGEMLKFEANIIGEPPADVVWEKDGKVLESQGKAFQITSVPYNTKLVIRSCKRSDQGAYYVTATNSVGRDQVIVNLTILDKPGPPEDLQISGVTASGCNLKWKRPKDDGGCQISYYQAEKFDLDSGLWIPCGRATETTLEVKGLQEGKKYKFRVTAINEEGESLTCESKDEILAKDPYSEPGAPTNLKLVDYDRDSVDLRWLEPIDDGGAEITGYLIEKRVSGGRWERAHEVPGTQLKCTVPNLNEGDTYDFRVCAISAGGVSAPSNKVGPVSCRARNLPPRIDRAGLIEVRCKAGESFNFDVNISGEPPPDKKWLINNKEIESSERVKVVFGDYNTKIFIRSATRKENGVLTLTAENVNGRDSVDIDVVVLDVPGAPMGPLSVKDMTAKDCWLEWKPPKDNGGMPIAYYIVEKCDESAGGRWVVDGETDGPISSYNVENLIENHRYRFRVRAVNKEGKSEPLETSGVYEARNPFEVPSKPGRPRVINFDSDWALLEWDAPEFDGGSKISGYVIEKRDSTYQKWDMCARTDGSEPKGKALYLITGNVYEFRVKAVNKAGESEPSEPSFPHKARPKNLTPRIDRNSMFEIKILAGELLAINVPVDGEPPPTKVWTKGGSKIEDGIHLTIHNEDYLSKIRIIDSKRSDSGVYKLVASNVNGTDTAECKVTVLDVPGPPENLQCRNIHKEYMDVCWSEPKDDGGGDIKYYIVEKQDQSNMRWIPCGESKTLKLRVEGLIEEHEYKFRIRAVNAQGESGPLIGPTPAVVAGDPYKVPSRPGKPFATNWSPDTIDLQWEMPKNDGGSAISKWIIEKKTKFGIWEVACECPGPRPAGSVTGLTEGTEYEFRIIAVNEAGNSEPSEPSDPITAEARFVHPWIDTSALQDMVVCAGQPISYNIPIRGSPKPLVKWSINKMGVKSGDHIDVTTTRRQTSLDIQFSERADAGTYALEVTNELGSAIARANVKVLDRPAPPDAPLRLSGVTSSSCNLKWGESPDDGGSPITHYLVEKMDTSRGSWVEADITTDLKISITGLINNKEYLMRVKAVNAIGDSDPLPLDKPFIAKNESDIPDPPGKPFANDWDKHHIDLEWARPLHDGGSPIEGYIIQKKEKGTTIWVDATTISTDTNKGKARDLLEGAFYQFRIVAINSAGHSMPGEPSSLIQARPRYLAPKILTPLKDVNVKAGNNFTIDVEYVGSPDPNVNWYNEGCPLITDERATVSAIAPFTTFHIVNCNRKDSGELTIKLVNESGSDKGSFYFNVLDVPGPPTGPIEYEEVTGNSVTISWRKPLDNGGSEITGYVIEKKDLDHAGGWVPAVNYIDASTLTHLIPRLLEGTSYEFRVFAVNAQGRSIPLTTDEPITPRALYDIPGKPGIPIATDADFTFIRLSWKPPSNNGGSKITGYDVERRDLLGGRWIRITTRPVGSCDFLDNDVAEGHKYEYKVRAHNAAGPGPHSDPSQTITAKPMKAAPKLDLDVLEQENPRSCRGKHPHKNTIRWISTSNSYMDQG